MDLPVTVQVESADGRREVLLKQGATLPAEARAVFATQKVGERSLVLRLVEGDGPKAKAVAEARCALPPGLPPNTWLATFVRVGQDLSVHVEVRENLRRLREDAELASIAGAKPALVYG